MIRDIMAGLDIGTSSLKFTVIDANSGNTIKNMRVEYEGKEISTGVVPVSMYEKTLLDVINSLNQEYNLLAIGFSFQMYSLCEKTPNGMVAYQWNSIWNKEAGIEKSLKKYMRRSGCPVDTIYPAYKLYSSRDKGKTFVPYGLKEHIIKFLTGNLVTDYSCASASGLLDIYDMSWNKELIEDIGFSLTEMPEIKRYNTVVGYLNIPGSGLSNTKIPIVTGLGDGMSASYACRDLSKICANLGTSMAARAFVDRENLNYSDKTWAYVFDEKTYIVGGISSNGCSVLNWLENLKLYNSEDTIETDKNGVMFFPWLHGERTPYWSSNLKGTFAGIEIDTSINSIITAVVKGVSFTIANLINIVRTDVGESGMIIAAGGGIHKKALLEFLSGSIPLELGILYDSDYLASHGAAAAAADAIGISAKKNIEIKDVIKPSFRYKDEYEKWLQMGNKFASLYDGYKDENSAV